MSRVQWVLLLWQRVQIFKHIRLIISTRHRRKINALSKHGYFIEMVVLWVLWAIISLDYRVLKIILNIKQHIINFIRLFPHPIFLGRRNFSLRDITRFQTVWLICVYFSESSHFELLSLASVFGNALVSHPMQFHNLILHKDVWIIWVCDHVFNTITYTLTNWILFHLIFFICVLFQPGLASLSCSMTISP